MGFLLAEPFDVSFLKEKTRAIPVDNVCMSSIFTFHPNLVGPGNFGV